MSEENIDDAEWKFIRTLGNGNFGVVELWKNSKTLEFNAIKRFEPSSNLNLNETGKQEIEKLWRKEVELMRNIQGCPYIVSAKALPKELLPVVTSPQPSLFMEYCPGGSLRSVLKLPENICGLRESDVLTILDHLSKAILYLHSMDIIHRDLKPDNILRYYDQSGKIIYKLSDLGCAKDVSQSQHAQTLVGTPQYLAPEVYMGKQYDKTVDYWSFGIIGFEIICGQRPFLHGESPSTWLPLVEKKSKEDVCVYRNEDGDILMSRNIPFPTHLSDVIKECLTAWLKTMLQINPDFRGKRFMEGQGVQQDGSSPEELNFKFLNATLSAKFLEVFSLKERLSFVVGTSGRIKVHDIQQKISSKTGFIPTNQLILTMDGKELQPNDPACHYMGREIFLVPRCTNLIQLKVKLPLIVNKFISEWDSMRNPFKLRKVWAAAIYFMTSELEKISTAKKSSEALKNWYHNNCSIALKNSQMDVEKAESALTAVLELEEQLQKIDSENNGLSNIAESDTNNHLGRDVWTTKMDQLVLRYKNLISDSSDSLVLRLIRTTELEELYYKVLKACGDWKSSHQRSPPFTFNEILVRCVCRFIVLKNDLSEDLKYNLKVQLDLAESVRKLVEEFKSIVTSLNQLTVDVMQSRCLKYKMLVQQVNGTDMPSTVNGIARPQESSNSLDQNGSPSRPSKKYNVRGGGYEPKMSHSTSICKVKEENDNLCQRNLSQSLNVSMKKSIHESCPLMDELLKESERVRSVAEERIKSLSESIEGIQEFKAQQSSAKCNL